MRSLRTIILAAAASLCAACVSVAPASAPPSAPSSAPAATAAATAIATASAEATASEAPPSVPPTEAPTDEPTLLPTEEPSLSPTDVPSAAPSDALPSAEPSPGDAGLSDTLLTAEDLPAGLTSVGIVDGADFDIDQASFDEFGGEDIVSQVWQGTSGTTSAVFDFRMRFPDEASATSYLDAAEAVLSEEVASALTETPIFETIGSNTRYYTGQATVPVTVDFHNFLFTVGDVAVKLFIAGPGATYEEARPMAQAAAGRIMMYQLMSHVPSEYADRCLPVDSLGGTTAQVNCTLEGAVSAAQYTLFDSVESMNGLFDLYAAENAPAEDDGSCETGPHLGTYTIGDEPAGQLLCGGDGTDHFIAWTDEQVRIMAFGSTSTAGYPELYEWWLNEAGPVR